MKILFWNARRLGGKPRKRQLKELIYERGLDIVCIQETKKESFNSRELNSYQGAKEFFWCWKASRGASGGILIGVNQEVAEVTNTHVGAYFLSCEIKCKRDNESWEVISVYGPVDNSLRESFLEELNWHLQFRQLPVVVGGDFNLYRFASEKSNNNLDFRSMEKFNSFIANLELRELFRSGPTFTWTNKQEIPVQVVLDRVLVSTDWDDKFPTSLLSSILRVGSDHTPLLLDTNELDVKGCSYFKFESAWLIQENFVEMVRLKMTPRDDSYILEYWNKKLVPLRRFLKGWWINVQRDARIKKVVLKNQLEEWDLQAEQRDLSCEEWNERYAKETELEHIYELEELLWHKRGGGQWLLEGDRNTEFFHRVANGRRRKCTIVSLEEDGRLITNKDELSDHIVGYYKELFRADTPSNIHLSQGVWEESFSLTNDEKLNLIRPFTRVELDKVIREAKTNTAPGPDGFNVHFYRTFWAEVREDLFEMLILLYNGELDLKRLNFGVISLIPKKSDPSDIRHFRHICVLNDCFKFISKVVTNRFTEVANSVISPTQTAFIPGRFILEGCRCVAI
ncbi:hypothetical protein DAI22_01g309400 [Oryza sativa Japonica Group]|nr:hypothetical protein DAI22_01g309400 [Oryza sativa Japonica Group]